MKNNYFINTVDNTVIIYMKCGGRAIIDLDDLPKILDNNSTYSLRNHGYIARITSRKLGNRTTSYLHRELMECPDGFQIDHVNGDRTDNRKCNLRIVTNQQNSQNRHKSYPGAKSEYRGVIWCERDNGWIARVKLNGKQHYLGTHKTEEKASQFASEFRKKYMPYSEGDK